MTAGPAHGEALIANPLCLRIAHCGRMAVIGPAESEPDGSTRRHIQAIGCHCNGWRIEQIPVKASQRRRKREAA